MPGGTVSISVDSYGQLVPVTQTVLCWALTDRGKVRIDTQGRTPRVVIPEEIISGKGALNLRIGGADIVSGYVAGTHVTVAAGNANPATGRNVNTCAAKGAAAPQATAVVVGRQVTLTINNGANGTVLVQWGDGTSTAGVAQNGTPAKTYSAPGEYTITITDETVATDTATIVVAVAV